MKRLIACSLGLLLWQAQAETQPESSGAQVRRSMPADAQLRLINQERAALHATWLDEQKACRQGFWVTDCLKNAQIRHRQALAELKRQQVQIEQALAQQRSQAALARVHDKQQAQLAERAASATVAPAAPLALQAEEREAQAQERALRLQQRIEAAELRQQQRERQASMRQGPGETGAAPASAP